MQESTTKPGPDTLDNFLRAQAIRMRGGDRPPKSKPEWEARRKELYAAFMKAMGPTPAAPSPLEAKVLGELPRQGYKIEKIVFQSRPDVWVTANAYVPSGGGRKPAVLVVHGHWPWARIDPTVQARCLGLVKLGFFVLAVDAFGSGERFTAPARGTYHGALFGGALWPVGHTLLGMQVYDNRRAVDYLLTRPEVDGAHLGITGASGGGNQSMNAGAADDRIQAVVPVCSVGTYQAYLHAACCVCEVLPGALRFTEEAGVLSLVAPRALLVINATQDAFQFSVGEAAKSIAAAKPIFDLLSAGEKIRHDKFESPHAYNQPMRETMYGWMSRWLKNEGDGKPIPEPSHEIEKLEDLRCYPDNVRPAGFLFPPTFAAREARQLLARHRDHVPKHLEEWQSTAVYLRDELQRGVFGGFPPEPKTKGQLGATSTEGENRTTSLTLEPEPGLPMPVLLRGNPRGPGRQAACVVLHLDGKKKALEHPIAAALLKGGYQVLAPDLRGTGDTKPARDAVSGAPDHNSAEHSLWIGRPLLGQWVFDVKCLADWLATQPAFDQKKTRIVGIGQAAVVALCAAGLYEHAFAGALTIGGPTTYVTELAYGAGTSMGLLAPGILRLGDIPQWAALIAPRRLVLADGVDPLGRKRTESQLREAFAFTSEIYAVAKAKEELRISEGLKVDELVAAF